MLFRSGGICTRCGARVELPEGDLVGQVIAGGEPDPSAFLPKRPRRGAAENTAAKPAGNKAKKASRAKATKSKGRPKRVALAGAPAGADGAPSIEGAGD